LSLESFSVSPLIPLIVLLLGVVVLAVSWFVPRLQQPGLIALLTVSAALGALLLMGPGLPASATLSAWGPESLLPLGLMLVVDPLAWLFGAGVLVVTLAALLTGVARPGGRRILARGAILLLAFAGLAALFADNLLTRALAWTGLDLVYFAALIFLARGEGIEPQAVLNLSLSSAGTLLAVGAALLISRTSPALSLRDAALTSQSTLLITLAALFRLGLFPLHLGLPTEANIRQGLGTLLRLIPAAVALEMMARLATFGFAEPVRPWLTVFGVGAAIVGAAQLWNASDPRQGITYVVIAQSGLALLAGLGGGVVALAAQALALLSGGALLFLAGGHDEQRPWLTALPVLGAAALLGAPLTVGFGGMQGLLGASGGLVLIGVVLAHSLLVAGLLRTAFWPGTPLEDLPSAQAAYLCGLALPAVLVLVAGLANAALSASLGAPGVTLFAFSSARSLTALVVLAFTLGVGLALWRFEARLGIRTRSDVVGGWLLSVIRLDWLYRWVWNGFRALGSLIFTLAEVLEGEGALLWTLVAALLLWLLLT
jgi:formate hydrogenlyase subunit 3/multisubunit Na+/H+ antiporter MnhD subunit